MNEVEKMGRTEVEWKGEMKEKMWRGRREKKECNKQGEDDDTEKLETTGEKGKNRRRCISCVLAVSASLPYQPINNLNCWGKLSLSLPSHTRGLFWLHLPSSSSLIYFYKGTMASFSHLPSFSVQLSASLSFPLHLLQPLSILGMQISNHRVWSWAGGELIIMEKRTRRGKEMMAGRGRKKETDERREGDEAKCSAVVH